MAINKHWWKILAVLLVSYTIIAGFLAPVPRLAILHESIRNLYFHVPMWFAMMGLLFLSLFYSIMFLVNENEINDNKAHSYAIAGVFFGFLGLITGSIWAKYTWGAWWSSDPKQTTAAISLLVYLAYLILRNSITEEKQRAKVSAIYNIFAAASIIPLLFIIPRMTNSLHPGSGGNPGFNAYDLDNRMRMVFYPAIIGWTALGIWMATLRIRVKNIENEILEN